MFIPVSLINLLHIATLRNECNKLFLAVINCFTGIFSNLCLCVRRRGVKLQNKMDFQEIVCWLVVKELKVIMYCRYMFDMGYRRLLA